MIEKRTSEADQLPENQSDWSMASELLEASQYEQIAQLLDNVRLRTEQTDNPLLVTILEATRLICLACGRCQAEVRWHHWSYQEADQREQALKQELQTIFELIRSFQLPEMFAETETPLRLSNDDVSSPKRDNAEPTGLGFILKRVQEVFSWGVNPQTQAQPPTTKPETAVASPPSSQKNDSGMLLLEFKERKLLPSQLAPPKNKTTPSLIVYCLGSFRLYLDDQLIDNCSSRKSQAVLKYLVTHYQQPVSKDILMAFFWPEAEPEAARRNLHQAIYALRQTLKVNGFDSHYVQFENDCYGLDPALDIWLDSEEFERHVQTGRRLEQNGFTGKAMMEYGIAEGLYQGDFMTEDLYEEWPQAHRQYLRQTYFSVTHRLAQYYFSRHEYAAAIALSQRALNIGHNCDEEAHQNLMKCYLAQGQRHLAIRQYHLCVQALEKDLDVPPSAETQTLYHKIVDQ